MMALALGLAISGYLMTSGGNKEVFEDIHELMANGFIVVVVLHVAGIVLHTIRHQEIIGLSMIDGKKANIAVDQKIPSQKSAFGILLVGLVVAFGLHLFKNYDSKTGALQFFGVTLRLSESEEEEGGQTQSADDKEGSEGENDDDD